MSAHAYIHGINPVSLVRYLLLETLLRASWCQAASINSQEQLVLLRHMLDLTVVHEDNITKILRPHTRKSRAWGCRFGLLTYLTVLDNTVVYRRRTNVQQLTCNIDLSCSFYYLFFSFVLIELKPFVLKGKVLPFSFSLGVSDKCLLESSLVRRLNCAELM